MTTSYLKIIAFILTSISTQIQNSLNLTSNPDEFSPFASKGYPLYDTIQKVGDTFGGGVVYYVDNTGRHGLICSLSDIIDPQSLELYKREDPGKSHNMKITAISINQGSAVDNPDRAEVLCNNYTNSNSGTGVFSDWYLPDRDELERLFKVKETINKVLEKYDKNRVDLLNKIYWSSSKTNDERFGKNWLFDFKEGNLITTSGFPGRNFVRAIRAF